VRANYGIVRGNMSTGTSQAQVKSLQDKPSLLALVTQTEMRQSLKRIAGMTDAQRQAYASRFMDRYREPLTEAGILTESKDYRIAEILLAAVNHGIFDRSY
jgi:hypothetical protein